jgi:hypothetical protein
MANVAAIEEKLQQLIELQKEQNQLLKRYLWRLRFSLLALLMLTTFIAVGLGFVAYHSRPAPAVPTNALPGRMQSTSPAGDIKVLPSIPGTT